MARRKQTPKVSRPTGKRRVIEFLKDVLIALLTCSAIFLAWQTPMATHLRDWVGRPAAPAVEGPNFPNEEALTPYALRVNNSLGAYGVSYDESGLARVFQRFSPFLGEAFSTVEAPTALTAQQWRALLEAPGFYCAFQGTPSLAVLSAWLGTEETLTGQAEALLLAREGDRVTLAWRDGNSYYRAATQMDDTSGLAQALEDFSPNGAAFAYALAATDDAYEALDPDVLLPVNTPQPQIYAASSPDLVGDRAHLTRLLSALGFLSGGDSAYETPGGLTVTESGDRLQVTPTGQVTYRSGEEGRYPISASDFPTAAQAAQAAWELLCRIAETFENTPAYVLTGVEPTEDGWAVTFGSRLEGVPVSTGEKGFSVRVVTEGRKISEFTFTLRAYTPAGGVSLLPSGRLAAAALRSIPDSDGRLDLRYSDNLSATLTAVWITGE